MNIPSSKILAIVAGISLAGSCLAGEDAAKKIAHSRSAAPPSISADATIVINGQVVVKGSNGSTGRGQAYAAPRKRSSQIFLWLPSHIG